MSDRIPALLPAAVRRSRPVRGLRASLRERPLTGAAASLHLPRWSAELVGGLPAQLCRALEGAQLLTLCGLLLQDAHADEGDPGVAPFEVVALLSEAQRRLTAIFPDGDSFWEGYGSLLRRQAASARWERDRRGTPQRLDRRLLRALGDKAALLRWPAFAVARLSGKPSTGGRLDRVLGRLFVVHQLLDDLTDVEEDEARGQQNGVRAALGTRRPPSELEGELRRARAVRRVCALARRELSSIARSVPRSCGLALHCRDLTAVCAAHELRSSGSAGLRILTGILVRLRRGLRSRRAGGRARAAPASPPRAPGAARR